MLCSLTRCLWVCVCRWVAALDAALQKVKLGKKKDGWELPEGRRRSSSATVVVCETSNVSAGYDSGWEEDEAESGAQSAAAQSNTTTRGELVAETSGNEDPKATVDGVQQQQQAVAGKSDDPLHVSAEIEADKESDHDLEGVEVVGVEVLGEHENVDDHIEYMDMGVVEVSAVVDGDDEGLSDSVDSEYLPSPSRKAPPPPAPTDSSKSFVEATAVPLPDPDNTDEAAQSAANSANQSNSATNTQEASTADDSREPADTDTLQTPKKPDMEPQTDTTATSATTKNGESSPPSVEEQDSKDIKLETKDNEPKDYSPSAEGTPVKLAGSGTDRSSDPPETQSTEISPTTGQLRQRKPTLADATEVLLDQNVRPKPDPLDFQAQASQFTATIHCNAIHLKKVEYPFHAETKPSVPLHSNHRNYRLHPCHTCCR